MRIQHNIAALNAYRNLTNNNSAVSKNLEKLSSGYRINRAGDDAAGLAISEKMRAQITGLETAQKNANDGISLVQTAEGALTEVHSMLNRMVELADQSANGTYQDEVDRENLQKEITSLKDEIDRISESTNFNGIQLLDGSLATKSGVEEISLGDTAQTTGNAATTFSQTLTLTAGTSGAEQTLKFSYTDENGNYQETSVTYVAGQSDGATATNAVKELQKVFGDSYTVSNASGGAVITITANTAGANETQFVKAAQYEGDNLVSDVSIGTVTAGKDATINVDMDTSERMLTIDGQKYQIITRGQEDTLEAGAKALYVDDTSTTTLGSDAVAEIARQLKDYGINATASGQKLQFVQSTNSSEGGLRLQIGDTSADYHQLTVSVSAMDTKSLGISGIDVSTQEGAAAAVDLIKNAINQVSSTRGDLGAIQNRLEHTINNLSVTTENMTAAESRIRDVDIAEEMMAYTKNNILVQSSQAMLAQANQIPQGVLQLLQ